MTHEQISREVHRQFVWIMRNCNGQFIWWFDVAALRGVQQSIWRDVEANRALVVQMTADGAPEDACVKVMAQVAILVSLWSEVDDAIERHVERQAR